MVIFKNSLVVILLVIVVFLKVLVVGILVVVFFIILVVMYISALIKKCPDYKKKPMLSDLPPRGTIVPANMH